MARRYDSRTTTFSPEGRLYQVEYALEAINNASSTIGILARDGVIIAADKMITSKLLDQGKSREKLYKIDEHVICAVAGLTADANILINYARLCAQRHLYAYGEVQPLEQLIIQICDTKQSYTQFGGLRPFGVSFLFGGWDRYFGYQLYHTDPSGNYSGWKATAIGVNNQSAQAMLKQDWRDDMSVDEALDLAAKVLTKTMDTTSPSPDKLEFSVLTRTAKEQPTSPAREGGGDVLMGDQDKVEMEVSQRMLSYGEVEALMKKARTEQQQREQS
eukprot:GHVS01038771.1.p1 GENE.GHVS01038771.1~~GHVS01038771.1.p1  ORF type:complete len:312 (+),score=83.69 GHVS01038771.1:115-936(+)